MTVGGYRISGAVSNTGSSGSGALYTAPANSFAIIQVSCIVHTSDANLDVDGRAVAKFTGVGQAIYGIYVGPGQQVFVATAGVNVDISGVQFTN